MTVKAFGIICPTKEQAQAWIARKLRVGLPSSEVNCLALRAVETSLEPIGGAWQAIVRLP